MRLANAETAKPTTPSSILMIYLTISVLSVPVALLSHSTVREAIAILCPFNFSQSLPSLTKPNIDRRLSVPYQDH